MLYYFKNYQSLSWQLWDINTVTASDFTVQIRIPKKIYQEFKSQNQETCFEKFFEKEIERQLNDKNNFDKNLLSCICYDVESRC
jgi:hypothetical protein